MSDTKELLELAARAMGICIEWEDQIGEYVVYIGIGIAQTWSPRNDSGDCAEMCAALGIHTTWLANSVDCRAKRRMRNELFSMHADDRAAAWRMAALRVAAAIGEAMR